ncbi:MAG: tetratricopeptide repeat protein [Bacteroidia bacterium]|nr:tetratricopeptide repeat protein [Bacteroidia bacterium]NNC85199.1 tetratricopeptide repeat protein [Bacteroidia bacterium]
MFNTSKHCVFFLVLIVLFVASCTSEKEQISKDIVGLEENVFIDQFKVDTITALQLIGLYSTYANKYSEDSLSAGYLFKGAELSARLSNHAQSINLFKKVCTEHPNFSERPIALFKIGFYAEEIKDYQTASVYYKKFIEEYPDDEFADDAAYLLKNLGQPDNAIL